MTEASDNQPGRPNIECERGLLLLVLVTIVILSEPVLRIIQINPRFLPSEVLVSGVHLIVSLVLVYVLWTGTPLFRWVCAVSLGVTGAYHLLEFLLAPWPGDYWAALYGVLGILGLVALLLSRRIKLYLRYREARRLGLSLGSS